MALITGREMGFFEMMGMAVWLMTKSRKYAEYPVACLSAWIEPAILHGQIHFFLGEDGKPNAYATWAWLAPDAERRLVEDPEVLLHVSEWNEGERLWIMDMVSIAGSIRDRIGELDAVLPAMAEARSLRRCEHGRVRKVVRWKRGGAS